MAIKINLKKNDETKNGFVGFSFTTFFWKEENFFEISSFFDIMFLLNSCKML